MTRHYIYHNEDGNIEFSIVRDGGRVRVFVDVRRWWHRFEAFEVRERGDELVVRTSQFYSPDDVHELVCRERGDRLAFEGRVIDLGAISGEAVLASHSSYQLFEQRLAAIERTAPIARTDEQIRAEVAELLSRMTLPEKIGQMTQSGGQDTMAIGFEVKSLPIADQLRKGRLGSIIQIGDRTERIFDMQRIAVNESRLGIPLLFCQDVIHGFDTIFPIPLAAACSFDVQAVEQACRIAAREATATGIMLAFAPMLDIARDPRWGRIAESAGEDTYLCAQMCRAIVEGYQGKSVGSGSLLACMKHFAGYGAVEGGREYNTAEISPTTLRNTYLPPFRAGVEAGAAAVMAGFNVVDGVPATASRWLLRQILRGEWGFEGMTISDYAAVDEIFTHGAAENHADAARRALLAGMDIEMTTALYERYLPQLVQSGAVNIADIDAAVARILYYKFKLGIMDDPYLYIRPQQKSLCFCEEHLAHSRKLAASSAVLLQNNNDILPLDKKLRIALIGPHALSLDKLGTWQFTENASRCATLAAALESKGCEVAAEVGCGIMHPIRGGLKRARSVAEGSDVIVLAIGESARMSGEARSRQNITVPDVQLRLIDQMTKLGKPVVLLIFSGRPLILTDIVGKVDAVLQCWFLGSQAANAIADILVGDQNPSGRLSVSFPKHAGQIPVYYNALNTGRPYIDGEQKGYNSCYIDGDNSPLYEFGFGLSYTRFGISNLRLSADRITADQTLTVRVDITNEGDRDGDQIVQLYIQDIKASIARPLRELKRFVKLPLAAKQTRTVEFCLSADDLKFHNGTTEQAEQGEFNVFVGFSSACRLQAAFRLVE